MNENNLTRHEQFINDVIKKANEFGIDEYLLVTDEEHAIFRSTNRSVSVKLAIDALQRHAQCHYGDFDQFRFFDLFNMVRDSTGKLYNNSTYRITERLHMLGKGDDSSNIQFAIRVDGKVESKSNDDWTRVIIDHPSIYLYYIDPVTLVPHPMLLFMSVYTDSCSPDDTFKIFSISEGKTVMSKCVEVKMGDLIDASDRSSDELPWYYRLVYRNLWMQVVNVLKLAINKYM